MVVYEIVDYVTSCEAVQYVKLMYCLFKKAFNIIKLIQFYTLIQINRAEELLAQDVRWVEIYRQLLSIQSFLITKIHFKFRLRT